MILPISYAYICMMGSRGLTNASKQAILKANYLMHRLAPHYKVLFTGRSGTCAHEFIINIDEFEGVSAEDVAKRLMDYGFHAPTMSWPVPGTLMIEPTESEIQAELDGKYPKDNNPLHNAPHTAKAVLSVDWDQRYPYSREKAAFPAPYVRETGKFWPTARRVDNVFGDRHLITKLQDIGTIEGAQAMVAAVGE